MADEHLPAAGKNGENNHSADDNPGQKTTQNSGKHVSPTKRDGLIDILEIAGGLVLGMIAVACADAGFHIWGFFFGFLAVVCGMAIVAHYLEKLGVKFIKTGLAVSLFLLLALFAFLAFHKPPQEPKPHFVLSLQIGDSKASTVILTNDFLFTQNFSKAAEYPNGSFLFKGIAKGCIAIPVEFGETNKILNFIVENDSPIKANDLEVSVGFPKDWELKLDSEKWHSLIGEHLITTGWDLEITNLQFWSAHPPWPLYPGDTTIFPAITNLSIPEFNNPTNKIGFFRLSVRATDFEEQLSANLLFVRTPSNSFFVKPFVTKLQQGTDGIWRVAMTPKELEDSQK
jgi:hypothetical protein